MWKSGLCHHFFRNVTNINGNCRECDLCALGSYAEVKKNENIKIFSCVLCANTVEDTVETNIWMAAFTKGSSFPGLDDITPVTPRWTERPPYKILLWAFFRTKMHILWDQNDIFCITNTVITLSLANNLNLTFWGKKNCDGASWKLQPNVAIMPVGHQANIFGASNFPLNTAKLKQKAKFFPTQTPSRSSCIRWVYQTTPLVKAIVLVNSGFPFCSTHA